MPANKSQHFVPQHYLRQFRIENSKQIAVAKIDPFQFIPSASINGQCQQAYFYQGDGELDDLLKTCEDHLAPILIRVCQQRSFNDRELVDLKFLAVILKVRTKKAVELAKVFPKKVAYEVIKSAIEKGDLPPPPNGWQEHMVDFNGVAGFHFKASAVPCWLEMHTLECKLLEAEANSFFITSDHPVVVMNQLFASEEPHRSFAGFSRSGFQLLLPISPSLCLFFYDPKVYKVGDKRKKLVKLKPSDVELVNSLQVQSADRCLYAHTPNAECNLRRLVDAYSSLRSPISESIKEWSDNDRQERLVHHRQLSPRLKQPWSFCTYRKNRYIGDDYRRNSVWSNYVTQIIADMDAHPESDVFECMERILGQSLTD